MQIPGGARGGGIAYAVDPTVQRREGLRSNTEKLAPALVNVFNKKQ